MPKRLFFFLSIFFILCLSQSSLAQVKYAKNRVILVFADDSATKYQEQMKEFKASKYKKAWKERETVIFGEKDDRNINWAEERAKRSIPPGEFVVVLIGLDQGDKMINTEGIESKELIEIIDRMPMRRRQNR